MITTLALLAAAAPQTAQQPTAMPGPARFGGTYHVATGTWTRERRDLSRGTTQVLYDNTAQSGYFTSANGPTGALAGVAIVDEGVIPGPTHPGPFPVAVADSAVIIESVTFAYCDLDTQPGVSGWQLDFYESYTPCIAPSPASLSGSAIVQGAPSNGCWTIDIDLTGVTFGMVADGGLANYGHQGDPDLDSFGVAYTYIGTGTGAAGPIIAGDPELTDPGWVPGAAPDAGAGTYFGVDGGCPGNGTGLGNLDLYFADAPWGPGCFFFGGYDNAGTACGGPLVGPYGGFFLEVSGSPNLGGVIFNASCTGNPNATGQPGEIGVFGSPFAADDRAVLFASQLPPNQFGIFAVGTVAIPPGTINSGNGTLCINPGAGGGLGRFIAPGQIKSTGPVGLVSLSTTIGEWSLTQVPNGLGFYSVQAGMTTHFQFWHREPVGLGFNFTGSAVVTWQ